MFATMMMDLYWFGMMVMVLLAACCFVWKKWVGSDVKDVAKKAAAKSAINGIGVVMKKWWK